MACADTPAQAPATITDAPGGKTDQNGFTAALGDRQDAIGIWLRDSAGVDEKGEFEIDYV
jgi:hypothetical protein